MDVEDLLASSLASSLIWKDERNIKSKLIERKRNEKRNGSKILLVKILVDAKVLC